MGKGLGIKPEGIHVAFTIGTGCLVFMDLVAHLIRKATGILDEDEKSLLGSTLKFILYVSFPKREEAIGYEMCKGLQELTKKKGLDNFEFIARFSNETSEYWGCNWKSIEDALSPFDKDNIKIWVCCKPSLNQKFDGWLWHWS